VWVPPLSPSVFPVVHISKLRTAGPSRRRHCGMYSRQIIYSAVYIYLYLSATGNRKDPSNSPCPSQVVDDLLLDFISTQKVGREGCTGQQQLPESSSPTRAIMSPRSRSFVLVNERISSLLSLGIRWQFGKFAWVPPCIRTGSM